MGISDKVGRRVIQFIERAGKDDFWFFSDKRERVVCTFLFLRDIICDPLRNVKVMGEK